MEDKQIQLCPCTSGLDYQACCEPYHLNQSKAPTPEALMRSRYVAYSIHLADYLIATTHASTRHLHARKSIESWAKQNKWLKLEICFAQSDVVEFKAYFLSGNQVQLHHERSTFKLENGRWYYLKGEFFD